MKNNGSLTEVPRTERPYDNNQKWDFGEGDVREAFQRVFSPKRNYVLFQTIANPKAVNVLKQYIGFRKNMDSPWRIQKIQKNDNPKYCPDANDRDNGLQFNNNLMDSYQHAIDEIANKKIGKSNFAHYPIVHTNGVHNLERDPSAIFWPRIYIVTDKKENQLKRIIYELVRDESLEVLRKHESPQFYQMAKIETLHKLKIAPIVHLEHELELGAQDLLTYVDFLAQMKESYQWTGPVIEVD